MAELWFVGVGLGDERDLSGRAVELLGRASEVFAEEYTSRLAPGSFERLEKEIGRPVRRLDRAQLESERPIVDALSRGGPVLLLVPGDPFFATTHAGLRRAAEEAGHRWHYLPNASIAAAAAGFLGLHSYKFGRTTSLPFPEPGFAPTSPLDVIRANRAIGAHTLVLLDLRPSEDRYLTGPEALGILVERDPSGELLPGDREVAVAARVGTPTASAYFGSVRALAGHDCGPPLHALVVPGPELHFEEREALERWRVGRPGP